MSGDDRPHSTGGSQEEAAAAWRAQRAQKSCLHAGKTEGIQDAAAPWHPMEAAWRVATLPFKIAHNTVAVSFRARTRPSWSTALDRAVSTLRTLSQNSTLSMSMVRSIHDSVITSACIPDGVVRTPCDLGGGLKAYWIMSEQLQHVAEAARFIFYVHGPNSSPNSTAHRALASRLALDAGAAVLMADYSRTPESTREQAHTDISNAYRWMVGQPGVFPASLLIMADGLGCALALNLCVELRDEMVSGSDDNLPAGIALCSPWVDLSAAATFGSSWDKHSEIDYLSKRILGFTANGFAGLSQLDDVAVSPIHASFIRFPPVHISFGACEVLSDQGRALSDKMRGDKVLVDVDEAEEMVHAFQLLAPFDSACAAGILRLATFARRMAPGGLKLSVVSGVSATDGVLASPSALAQPVAQESEWASPADEAD